jgi:hypothetical protein
MMFSGSARAIHASDPNRGRHMLDAVFILSGIVFFVITAAYADGCDRL